MPFLCDFCASSEAGGEFSLRGNVRSGILARFLHYSPATRLDRVPARGDRPMKRRADSTKENILAGLSMKELLEAGVHFGHQTRRWNPKMKRYIYGARNGIYIIDLHQTLKLYEDAQKFVQEIAANNGKVLFVGTKKQAQDAISEAAIRCRQYYINQRWLGGMLTNFRTI